MTLLSLLADRTVLTLLHGNMLLDTHKQEEVALHGVLFENKLDC